MSVVAVVEAAGTAASTTTAVALAAAVPLGVETLLAECDPSGGDVAAWAGLSETPGWTTSVSTGDRSWEALCAHMQQLASGLSVLAAPSRARVARTVVRESASRFAPLLAAMPDVVTFADCGRYDETPSAWVASASLVLLLVRQASAPATVARVDRAAEVIDRLGRSHARVGVVVVGAHPYDPSEIAAAVGGQLFGVLAEDPIGAGQVGGGWTVGRGAGRSALLRSARPVAEALIGALAAPAGLSVVDGVTEAAG